MKTKTLVFTFVAILIFLFTGAAQAQEVGSRKKKKSGVAIVSPADVFYTTVQTGKAKKRKRPKTKKIACFRSAPGKTKTTKKGLVFTGYSKILKTARKKGVSSSKIKSLTLLQRKGRKACKNSSGDSLKKYTGSFGPEEARLLYERFAFAGTPAQIDQGVAAGLEATVLSLTTFTPEPELDSIVRDLECDGRFSTDENNEFCNPADPNDLDLEGLRYGIYYRFRYSANPFFQKLFFFLHDERMSASLSAAGSRERHAVRSHLALLYRAAQTGDYMQFMSDWNKDQLGHLRWLDGDSNRGMSPNENYAREFWELGTVGPRGLDGASVYNDIDVAQSALAFTGWTIITDEFDDGTGSSIRVEYPAYSTALHFPGPKLIFAGTPYAASVDNHDDVLAATFRHPRTAEHLAEDIWKEFINSEPTSEGIRDLAREIRKHNYNLIPVFRTVMQSQAIFSPRYRKSLLKHPVEALFGFLRITNYPADLYRIERHLRDLEQVPLKPPSVFGWDDQQLAGEPYVLPWRNAVLDFMNRGSSLIDEDSYDIRQRWFSGLVERQSPSMALVERLSGWFNIPLSDSQKAHLEQYLNYDRTECKYYHTDEFGCTEGEMFLRRELFDAAPDGENRHISKAQGLAAILLTLPEFRLK